MSAYAPLIFTHSFIIIIIYLSPSPSPAAATPWPIITLDIVQPRVTHLVVHKHRFLYFCCCCSPSYRF